jgi:hypothetical protein
MESDPQSQPRNTLVAGLAFAPYRPPAASADNRGSAVVFSVRPQEANHPQLRSRVAVSGRDDEVIPMNGPCQAACISDIPDEVCLAFQHSDT